MTETYTQGLIVTERTLVRRERRLPMSGEVLVREGEEVRSESVVVRAELPGPVEVVNVARLLGVPPHDVARSLLKIEGDPVERDEILGRSSGLFGLFKSTCTSPMSGTVESISSITGQVIIRGRSVGIELSAYVDGRVVELFPTEGALVQTEAALVQGIFGVGGESWGELAVPVSGPNGRLSPEQLGEGVRDRIVVAGRGLEAGSLSRVVELDMRGLIVGSITDRELREFLGFDLGSAITGSEQVPFTLIVTEGFGDLPMAERTFEVLSSLGGRRASINGKTQIRAGVIRPEVIVPLKGLGGDTAGSTNVPGSLKIGARVRGAREPYLGRVGIVSGMPDEPVVLETEAKAWAVELTFEDGTRALIARSNVEAV